MLGKSLFELDEMHKLLRRARYFYYEGELPIMEDYDYDMLEKEYDALADKLGIPKEKRVSNFVGFDIGIPMSLTSFNNNMKLGEFIERFVERNSMIRLLYKNDSGHEVVLENWDCVSMEHSILDGKGPNRHYINNEVIGITDILTGGPYSEAINIVIEKLPVQPFIEETPQLKINFESNGI